MKPYVWVKSLAAVSFICAAIVIGGCSWAMKDSMRDLRSHLNASGVSQIEPHRTYKNNARYTRKVETYEDVLRELAEVWKKNQPIMSSLSAVAIVTGTIQLLASFSLIMSDSKTIIKPFRRWAVVHSIVFIALLVLLLSTMAIKIRHGKISNHWPELLDYFYEELKKKRPEGDFTNLIYDLKKGLIVFYGTLSQNLVLIFVIFILAIIFLRRLEYEIP